VSTEKQNRIFSICDILTKHRAARDLKLIYLRICLLSKNECILQFIMYLNLCVRVCVCVCVCVCVLVCVCARVCVYVLLCAYVHVRLCVYFYVRMCMCMHARVCVGACVAGVKLLAWRAACVTTGHRPDL
jgi:hypothetical protein